MSDSGHLLPDNAPPFLQEMSRLSARIDEIPTSEIETIWDAWRCPAGLLPWLAWALSVDVWDDAWPDTVKRQAIADSPYYHRIKGTVRAIRVAASLANRPFDLTEWFDQVPPGRRGTARIFIETTLDDIPRILREIRPLVMAAKPKSRAIAFGAGEMVVGLPVVGAGLLVEELTTIEPYAYLGEDADGVATVGVGLLSEELTTIGAYA